ncbi:hypothetical protein ACFLQN_01040 [Candidatus Aenigmatarchaeota archaeon]
MIFTIIPYKAGPEEERRINVYRGPNVDPFKSKYSFIGLDQDEPIEKLSGALRLVLRSYSLPGRPDTCRILYNFPGLRYMSDGQVLPFDDDELDKVVEATQDALRN